MSPPTSLDIGLPSRRPRLSVVMVAVCGLLIGVTSCGSSAPEGPQNPADAPTPSYSVVATLGLPDVPQGVTVNPTNGRVYVVNATLSVFDGNTQSRIANASIANSSISALGVAVDPTTSTVYAPYYSRQGTGGAVSVIDGMSNTIRATIPVGAAPYAAAVDPTNRRILTANHGGDTVSVIDADTNRVATTVRVGESPMEVAVDTSNGTAYCTNQVGSLSIFEVNSPEVVTTIPVGRNPGAVAVDSTTHTAYVANYDEGTISVVDGTQRVTTGTIRVGINPTGVAIHSANRLVFVTNLGSNTVSVISTEEKQVVATIPVGTSPVAVAVDPVANRVYVTNTGDNTLSVISAA